MENVKKQNVFVRMAKACYSFKDYPKLIEARGRSIFVYILALALINAILWAYIPFGSALINMGGFKGIVNVFVPNFELSYDNGLHLDTPVELEEGGDIILVDTSKTADFSKLNLYARGLIADSQQIAFKNDGETTTLVFSEMFENLNLDQNKVYMKDDLLTLSKYFDWAMFFVGVIIYLCSLVSLVMFVLICSLIALIMSGVMKTKLLYAKLFKLTMYAVTVSALVSSIFNLAGGSMPLGFIGSYGIVAVYLYFALRCVKEQDEGNVVCIEND